MVQQPERKRLSKKAGLTIIFGSMGLGGLLLVLGLIGWISNAKTLSKINAGTMDEANRASAVLWRNLGITGFILGFIVFGLSFIMWFGYEAARAMSPGQ